MSDAEMEQIGLKVPSQHVTMVRMVVHRNKLDGLYYVMAREIISGWRQVSRGYPHSTSAYARLGRIVSSANKQES